LKPVKRRRDKLVEPHGGEMIVIPKGVEHKTTSKVGYKAVLEEPEDAPNTGHVEREVMINKIESV
jgi:hypothetical protein